MKPSIFHCDRNADGSQHGTCQAKHDENMMNYSNGVDNKVTGAGEHSSCLGMSKSGASMTRKCVSSVSQISNNSWMQKLPLIFTNCK